MKNTKDNGNQNVIIIKSLKNKKMQFMMNHFYIIYNQIIDNEFLFIKNKNKNLILYKSNLIRYKFNKCFYYFYKILTIYIYNIFLDFYHF